MAQRDAARPLPRHRPAGAAAAAVAPDFDYVGSFGDERGERCPLGSHIRRMYPRGSQVAGGAPHKRRIVRRGLTYGPPHDRQRPHDGQERGVLGLFIGVSLADQFEFLMAEWAGDGLFAPSLGRSQDPFLSTRDGAVGTFRLPVPGGEPSSPACRGWSRRGAAPTASSPA